MIRGIVKARNEAHIIQDALDSWAEVCDAIHVYCDHCDDRGSTAMLAKGHPAVVEVVESDLLDPDRERAEWFNRRWVLQSALRFMDCSSKSQDWIVYFDADEILDQFDTGVLDPDRVCMVACHSYDCYITPEDKDVSEWHWKERRWFSREYQWSPYFYSCRIPLDFYKPDQRNMDLPRGSTHALHGLVRHYGKGLSVKKWDEKCQYYAEVFGPKYAAKWEARKGQAVKVDMKSDFGLPLATWEEIKSGKVASPCRNSMRLTR